MEQSQNMSLIEAIPCIACPDNRRFIGEHWDNFSLINMNGREYDPVVARFLSPDPYVQAADYSQSFNRYSYVLNNPLKYTDPDGEWVHLAVGAVFGGFTNWIINGSEFNLDGIKYFGIGAAAGLLSAGIGSGVSAALANSASGGFGAGFVGTAATYSTGFTAGSISGAAAGFTNGMVLGIGNGMMAGNSFGDAFFNHGIDKAWKQGLSGALIGGVLGGIESKSIDRNFWTGSRKQKVVGNQDKIIDKKAFDRLSIEQKKQYSEFLEETEILSIGPDGSYSEVQIGDVKNFKIKKMDGVDDAVTIYPEDYGQPTAFMKIDGNNVELTYPVGRHSDGYIYFNGWRWHHSSSSNSWLPDTFIYSHRSSYSSLFFWLKYIK
jgi:RHS repeat-associated protein